MVKLKLIKTKPNIVKEKEVKLVGFETKTDKSINIVLEISKQTKVSICFDKEETEELCKYFTNKDELMFLLNND